jgi:hypothetical protein
MGNLGGFFVPALRLGGRMVDSEYDLLAELVDHLDRAPARPALRQRQTSRQRQQKPKNRNAP